MILPHNTQKVKSSIGSTRQFRCCRDRTKAARPRQTREVAPSAGETRLIFLHMSSTITQTMTTRRRSRLVSGGHEVGGSALVASEDALWASR